MGTIKLGSSRDKIGVTVEPKKVFFNGNNVKYLKSGETEIWGYIQPLVPTMTSNTTPKGVASASHLQGLDEYAPWKAFDNDDTTIWTTLNIGASVVTWLKYEFTTLTQVMSVSITPYKDHNGTHFKDFIIQGSNDDSNWIDLCDTTTNVNGNNIAFTVDLTKNIGYYKYYRLYMLNSYTNYRAITSLQFYGTQLKALIPAMTSDTAPHGVASASSSYGTYPYNAFDNNIDTYWSPSFDANQYVQYTFENTMSRIDKVVVIGTPSITYHTTEMDIYLLNENDEWVLHQTYPNMFEGMTSTKTFIIDIENKKVKYKGIRLLFKEVMGKFGSYANFVNSIQVYT